MVPKKHKSKRKSTQLTAKISRKAREQRRKARKDAKTNPNRGKLKKDPGIPNLWPFKEKLLNQIEENRIRVEEEKKRQKQQRAQLHNKNRNIKDITSMAELVQNAEERGEAFGSAAQEMDESGLRDTVDAALTGRKDNSVRAYYREFRKVVDHADVILEVLDARDPLGCRTKSIERMILNQATNKRVILVLNKIDLVPRENVEAWLKYLRNEFPTVAFKASTQQQRTNLGQARGGSGKTKGESGTLASGESQLQKSEAVGADALIQLLKNYCRNANIKTAITVGVIGYPNVGKSSLINSLRRSRVCQVGSTPGITKAIQEIHLDKHVKLLDSPGIVFAKPVTASTNSATTTGRPDKASQTMADVVLRNCIKVELLDDPIAPVEAIVARCNSKHLMVFYNLPFFRDHKEFLVQLARQRGRLGPGGIPNMKAAAQIVLNDWNVGRIQFYTEPPTAQGKHTRPAQIVKGWSEEFQLADITGTADSEILAGTKSKSQLGRTALSMAADEHSGDRELMTEEEIAAMEQSSSGESEYDSEGDDSMYDSEEDVMSEDEPVADRPVLRVNAQGRANKNKNQTDGQSRKQVILTPEEELINPQTRGAAKKEFKKMKKDKRRQEAAQLRTLEQSWNGDAMENESGDGDDDYNFSNYFQASTADSMPAEGVDMSDEEEL